MTAASSNQISDKEPSADEDVVRLALVLNGGVSLAVWMSGVVHEIDRLLERFPESETSQAWREILQARSEREQKEKRPIRVVVDYVAGTSAGGLNGTLLATAIARGAPVPDLKALWSETARLTLPCLLAEPDKAGGSLLDGEFLSESASSKIGGIQPGPHDGEEITLLVTATAMSPSPLGVEDAFGRKFNVSDQRRVYRFETRDRSPDGEDGFGDTTSPDLGQAARASAGFPFAFVPIEETDELRARSRGPQHQSDGPVWLIDGGVLDNAPFEPLLDEIGRNPRPDAGERWVVYVVPSAQGFLQPSKDGADEQPASPPGWPSVVGKLWGLKDSLDLQADIETLRRNALAARSAHQRPEELIVSPLLPDPSQTAALFTLYQRTRAAGFVQFLHESTSQAERLKRLKVTDTDVDDLLNANAYFIPQDMSPTTDGRWQWGTTVARRLTLWMSRQARGARADPAVIRTLARVETELRHIERALTDLYRDPSYANKQPVDVLSQLSETIEPLLKPVSGLMAEALASWTTTVRVQNAPITVEAAWERLLSVEVLLNFAEWHVQPSPPPFDVVIADPGAPQVSRCVLGGDPTVAEKVACNPNAKLYGTRLRHFGAFGHTSYRRHDWVWGRVDGALCLASALLKDVDRETQDTLYGALVEEVLQEEGSTREALAEQTGNMLDMTDTKLLVEMLGKGEVDTGNLTESVERVLTSLGRTRWFYPAVVEVVDTVGDALKTTDQLRRGLGRLAGSLRTAAGKVTDLLDRLWP